MSDRHVLVVDDEPHVTLVIEHTGRLSGFTVTTAGSLREARAALESPHDVDLVLLDVKLPDGSGLDFLEEIRASPDTDSLPVIVLTGAGYDDILERAGTLGARCVTKPFSPSKLGRMVADALGINGEPA